MTLCVRIGALRAWAFLAVGCGCRYVPTEALEALSQALLHLRSRPWARQVMR